MPTELLSVLPTWLLLGVAVGAAVSVLVAGVFYFGDRLFPPAEPNTNRRVDGTLRRHAEVRRYLDSIDEPYIEEYEQDDLRIAFYLPNRDVAITFDPKVFFRLADSSTYVVLCEDEMPIAHLGGRLPFDVPTQPRRTPVSSDPVVSAYQYLGLSEEASEGDIRAAYRSLAKETHPDRGGSNEEFKQLQEAYATAKNHTEQTA